MRWATQEISQDDAGRLPGVGDTVIRRFDAPEALDMRFHEVRAKSALSRVPAASRLPFNWTVNPYRGCTHACLYCLAPETPVLLADGHTRAIKDLRVGDRIYGTEVAGRSRRYVLTEVQAHWSTVKPAFRVTLEDGTELVTSGEHRFLTRTGWKHVSDAGGPPAGVAAAGPPLTGVASASRPTLAVSDRLGGTGRFAAGPAIDDEYRRGYLCGLDAFRTAAIDPEAHARADHYAAALGLRPATALPAGEVLATGVGVATQVAVAHALPESPASLEDVRRAVAWPWDPSLQWSKGFLAGVYDAQGSCTRGVLRISDTDPAMLQRTADCLRRLAFRFVIEDRGLDSQHRAVRLLGGTSEQVRFFHTVAPAVRRKCSIEGRAIRFDTGLGVVSVEPLGVEIPMYDITTGTGDFIANGVVSHNCFARPTHEYLDLDAGRDFEREIVVKVNVPEVLRAELAKPSWNGETVALGTNTDPYQWVEGRYKLMRGIWEAMRDFRNPCSILTKSPLLLRDLDLLKEIQQVADVSACLSVPTLEEKAWRATEPHTPHPRARLEAVAELNRNGIPTGVLIAPLMPGINDNPHDVEQIVELATEAKATYIGGQTLFLRGPVRTLFFEWLHEHRPDLVPRYERLYAKGGYLSNAERHRIETAAGAPWLRKMERDPYRHRHRGTRRPVQAPLMPVAPTPRTKQESLF